MRSAQHAEFPLAAKQELYSSREQQLTSLCLRPENIMSDPTFVDTRRLNSKPQDITDAYGAPSNFLEIDVSNPQTVGVGRTRYTTYDVRMRVSSVQFARWAQVVAVIKVEGYFKDTIFLLSKTGNYL